MADDIDEIDSNQVWSASYAKVEVFQQIYNGTAVMRRQKDSFVNVTQILKCAQYDKPHRTRFLEREIHTGIHEKVQGGYGKYQGTWVPLERAIALAMQLNVYDALRNLLEYKPRPGENPPTAPRSLESIRKRRNASLMKKSAISAVKRRTAGPPRGNLSASLSNILNQPSSENKRPSSYTPTQQQNPGSAPVQHQNQQPVFQPKTPKPCAPSNWNTESAPGSIQPSGTPIPYLTPDTLTEGRACHTHDRNMTTPSTRSSHKHQNTFSAAVPSSNTYNLRSEFGHRRSHSNISPKSHLHTYSSSQPRGPPRFAPTPRALQDITNSYHGVYGNSGQHPLQQHWKSGNEMPQSLITPPSSSARYPALVNSPSNTLVNATPTTRHNTITTTTASGQNPQTHTSLPACAKTSPLHNHGYAHDIRDQHHGLSGTTAQTPVDIYSQFEASPSLAIRDTSDAYSSNKKQTRSYSGSGDAIPAAMTNHTRSVSSASQMHNYVIPSFEGKPQQPDLNKETSSSDYSEIAQYLACKKETTFIPQRIVDLIKLSPSFNPNTPLSNGKNTALHLAVQNGHWDIVQLLLECGADPACANHEGKTPLMLVVQDDLSWQQRKSRIFPWLLDILYSSLIKRDKCGRTVIHWACTRPINSLNTWPDASLYYTQCLVVKFYYERHLEVFAWNDYLGRNAIQLATQSHLSDNVLLIDTICNGHSDASFFDRVRHLAEGTGRSQAIGLVSGEPSYAGPTSQQAKVSHYNETVSGMPHTLNRNKDAADSWPGSQAKPGYFADNTNPNLTSSSSHVASSQVGVNSDNGRCESVYIKSMDIIRATTEEIRHKHELQLRTIDEDSAYAAQLLLELRAERDSLYEEKHSQQEFAALCNSTENQERNLKHRISSVIQLQQSARASAILHRHESSNSPPGVDSPHESISTNDDSTEALRSEYLRLKQQAGQYHIGSQKLAAEYAELSAIVKPWPRPPVLSLISTFDDSEASTASDGSHTIDTLVDSSKPHRESSRGRHGIAVVDSESADIKAINAALDSDVQRFQKFERVVSAACGDLSLDHVRDVAGPVLSVLNNGNTL